MYFFNLKKLYIKLRRNITEDGIVLFKFLTIFKKFELIINYSNYLMKTVLVIFGKIGCSCKVLGYMTIQIRTTQIPTIQILEKN